MTVHDNQRFGPSEMAGFKYPLASSPAATVLAVAINRHPATDRTRQ
jgi:hypothetical protein